jgi:hypothetical protein
MQLDARPVQWQLVVDAVDNDRLGELMASDDVDTVYIEGRPWPSDSCVQYTEVAEMFAALEDRLTGPTREFAYAVGDLINEDMAFPQDLGPDLDSEIIAGALDPEHVRELAEAFAKIDYADLDRAFEQQFPSAARKIVNGRINYDRDSLAQYIRQWQELLAFASQRGAGVLIELS